MELKESGDEVVGSTKPDTKRQRLPSTTEEKIEFALKLKEEGNNLFRNQEFKKANFKYAKIFLYTQGLPGRPHNNPGEEILEATGAFGDLGIGLGCRYLGHLLQSHNRTYIGTDS